MIDSSSASLRDYVPANISCFDTEIWLGTCSKFVLAGSIGRQIIRPNPDQPSSLTAFLLSASDIMSNIFSVIFRFPVISKKNT